MSPSVSAIVIALISGGTGTAMVGLVKDWRSGRSRRPSRVDASVATIAKAREQLMEDNTRLRAERDDLAARHAAERAEWIAERNSMRDEIDALEARLRLLLDELVALKLRHAT